MSGNGNTVLKSSVVIAVSFIVCTVILAQTATNFKTQNQTITVTGSARKRITSDYAVWSVSVSRTAPTLAQAYQPLKADIPVLKNYLLSKGIKLDELSSSAINTNTNYEKFNGMDTGKITGYSLSESFGVRSNDVRKIERIASEVTELMDKGLAVSSGNPEFHYSKLSEMKITMLAEAAKDAKQRAEQIVTSTGSKVGVLRSSHMGVMQITAPDSYDVSGQGINDTTTIDKDITAVVNAEFSIE